MWAVTFIAFRDHIGELYMAQVPDTSRVAALNLAQKLSLPYREGFIKNRYVGRTFIMPGQQMRYVIISLPGRTELLKENAVPGVKMFAGSSMRWLLSLRIRMS